MADSLQQLAADVHRFADERDWHRYHSPKNIASALIVEAAELLEHFQWRTEAESEADALPPEVHAAVADEMADVLLYLVQLGNRLGVDPVAAARAKLARNQTRFPPVQAPTEGPERGR
jgi:NTP pyrophosphatase (non-canonical NTP hydrolase)